MGYEVDFLSVGNSNGDAICVRHGNATTYEIHVTDGGYRDTGERVIEHIRTYYGDPNYIANVVLSHQDADHVTGLIEVVRYFNVGAVWMNRPWLYAAEIIDQFHGNFTVEGLTETIKGAYPLLVELEEAAVRKGTPVYEAFAYTEIGAFTVLAPSRERYLALIPQFDRTPDSYAKPVKGIFGRIIEAAKALAHFFETWGDEALEENPAATSPSNECCVVQLGDFEGKSVLLTADAGPAALNEAADIAASLGRLSPPTFVQVPHHGSRRNVTPTVLNRWLGQPIAEDAAYTKGTAFCSVGSNQPQYPRKRVANAFLRRGYPVYKTAGLWIWHSHQMPERSASSAVSSLPFTQAYEE